MESIPARILLATDQSRDSASATRAAVALASRGGSELHVVHVAEDLPGDAATAESAAGEPSGRERPEASREELVRRVQEAGADVAGAHVREGRPVEEVLAVAEEIGADLVLVGSRGLGAVGRLVLGSVSEGLVHNARRPVLVVRGGAWPPGRVVIADDASEQAGLAARLAAGLATLFGARVELVGARPTLPVPPEGGRALTARATGEAQQRAESALQARAGELEEILGYQPRTRAFVGEAAASILEVAEETGEDALVAVGARGRGTGDWVGLGSVSDKVLRSAPGPVLVMPRAHSPASVDRYDGADHAPTPSDR